MSAGVTRVNLENENEDIINPATSENQDTIITNQESVVSTNNSTTTTLGNGGVFTGTGEDISQFAAVAIMVITDQDSATDGLSLEWSTDNINWDHIQTHSVVANTTHTTQAMMEAQYFRLVYTNGTTPQGAFRLQVILMKTPSIGEIQQLQDPVDDVSDAQLVRSVLTGKKPNGEYANVQVTAGGNTKISLEELESGISVNNNTQLRVTNFDSAGSEVMDQKTAFGEAAVAEPSPVVQVQFPYNINTHIWEIRDNGGTASVVDNMANLSTGAGANQSSTILSRTPVKYNPGQGGKVPFTAIFDTAVANNTQYVGIGNTTDGYFFGYEGTVFGVLMRKGGLPETRRLAITTASNTAEDIVITLNGVAENVTVTAAGADTPTTRVVTANEIAAHDFSNVGEGWEVHNMGASIFFTSFSDGAKSGTFEITTATTAAGTFTQGLAGVTATETIVAQTDWNRDKMDGTGGSGMTLDTTKGNVYKITYQWLGFGPVDYFVEEPVTKRLFLVHRVEYNNANVVSSVNNPTLPLYVSSKNTSNTTDIVLKVGSMGGFVEGRNVLKGLPHSLSVETTGIGITETPVMTIHSHDIYQGTINRVKIKMTVGSVSVDGTKNSIIRVRKNAVITGPVSFTPLDSNVSTIHRDTTATGVSGGTIIFATGAGKIDELVFDLEKLGIELAAPDFLTVTIQATAAANIDAVSTLNWLEQF